MYRFTKNIKEKINFFIQSSFLYKEHNLTILTKELTHETMLELIWTILPRNFLVLILRQFLWVLCMLVILGREYVPIIILNIIKYICYWLYHFFVFKFGDYIYNRGQCELKSIVFNNLFIKNKKFSRLEAYVI